VILSSIAMAASSASFPSDDFNLGAADNGDGWRLAHATPAHHQHSHRRLDDDVLAPLLLRDALVVCAALGQLRQLYVEAKQLRALGVKEYMSAVWNWIEVSGCLFILVGSVAHFGSYAPVVRYFGSVGSLLLWLGVYNHFTLHPKTGPLVRVCSTHLEPILACPLCSARSQRVILCEADDTANIG
jgi:hypothetical protein